MPEKELYQPKLLIKAYDKKDNLTLYDEVFNMMNCKNILCKESRTRYEYDKNKNIISSVEDIMVDSNRSKIEFTYSDNKFTVATSERKFPKVKLKLNKNIIAEDRNKISSITRTSENVLMKSKEEDYDEFKTISTATKSKGILDSLNNTIMKRNNKNYSLYKKTDFIVTEIFDDILFKGIEIEYTYDNDILIETNKSYAIYAYTNENELICVDKKYIARNNKEKKSIESIITPSMKISEDNKTLTIYYGDSEYSSSLEIYNIDYKSKCLVLLSYKDQEESSTFTYDNNGVNYDSTFNFGEMQILIQGKTNKYSPSRFSISENKNKLMFNSAAFLPAIYNGDTEGLCVNIKNKIDGVSIFDKNNGNTSNLSFKYDNYGVIKELVYSITNSENAAILNKYYIKEIDDITIIESLTPIISSIDNLKNNNYFYQVIEVKDELIVTDYRAILIKE